ASSEPLLRDGRTALEDEQNRQAIAAFLRLLEEYPQSAYRDDALGGLEEAIASERIALRSNEELVSRLRAQIGDLEESLDRMEAEVASLRQANQEPAVPVTELPPSAVESSTPEAEAAAARLERLRTAYTEYREREAETLREDEEAGRIAAKLYLDDFLQEETVREVLPGLGDTIREYDRAFEASGRSNALLEAGDLVFNLSSMTDEEERRRYLTRELENSSDPRMQEFIRELLSFVEE
ncbi:MAG: hypothetical protein ACOCW6_03165, partial [Spirochaetota bacterium]